VPAEKDLFGESDSNLVVEQPLAKDLLSGSTSDLTDIVHSPLAFSAIVTSEADFADPFDTSAVNHIVAPKETELKFLEKELLADQPQVSQLKQSLSDPDFDPRADVEELDQEFENISQRKSSLSLHIGTAAGKNKAVAFAVQSPDFLKLEDDHCAVKKPLTPYYSRESSLPAEEDPFGK
jgi:hypothetical protein